MKYSITGSLGNISKPVVEKLASAGHEVTVISSNADKKSEIEQLNAKAAIGSVDDREFLAKAFSGADAVYLMIPNSFGQPDFYAYQKAVADNYVAAIKESGVKFVVLLSSIGAHLRKGAGQIDGLGYLEEQLLDLREVNVKMLRPSYFFYNLHALGDLIRHAGIMGSNSGGAEDMLALTHTSDIAEQVVKHLSDLNFRGHTHQYIVSDERTFGEIANVLSESISRPGIPWVQFSDEDSLQGMLQAGLGEDMAKLYVQMGKAFREGKAQEDFLENKPAIYGKVKLEDFAKEFAAGYNQL